MSSSCCWDKIRFNVLSPCVAAHCPHQRAIQLSGRGRTWYGRYSFARLPVWGKKATCVHLHYFLFTSSKRAFLRLCHNLGGVLLSGNNKRSSSFGQSNSCFGTSTKQWYKLGYLNLETIKQWQNVLTISSLSLNVIWYLYSSPKLFFLLSALRQQHSDTKLSTQWHYPVCRRPPQLLPLCGLHDDSGMWTGSCLDGFSEDPVHQ